MVLLKSVRFQGVLAVAVIQALVLFGYINGVQSEGLANIVSAVVAAAVAIGSLDRVGSHA